MNINGKVVLAGIVSLAAVTCSGTPSNSRGDSGGLAERVGKYTTVRLTTDLSVLTENQRRMIPLLIEAGRAMDEIFWVQAYGDRAELLDSLGDGNARRFAEINYGPWDRLADNEPFLAGFGPKPKGANFYPDDMTREEFEAALEESGDKAEALKSLYSLVLRYDAGIM